MPLPKKINISTDNTDNTGNTKNADGKTGASTLKKVFTVVSVVIVFALFGLATWFFIARFSEIRSAESFRTYVESFGAKGVLVAFVLQFLQVFVALIPGEAVEIGLGYAFGALGGTLICYAGVAAASALVFILVKTFGVRAIEVFCPMEKIERLSFVRKLVGDRARLRHIVFLLFIIPGTPKDLFTYFFGLTPLSPGEFLVISLIARFPSVISSTVGGMLLHDGNYLAAGILFAATAVISLLGLLWYDRYTAKNKK